MARQRHTAEEIINKLRETEVGLANGLAVPEVCRKLGVTERRTTAGGGSTAA